MSRAAQVALVFATVAVAVAAFVLMRPGAKGDSDPSSKGPAAPPVTSTARETGPEVPTVRIKGGEVVGGLERIEVREGGRIRFLVIDDSPGEVHLHGYDVDEEVGPGQPASFNVKATITGRFEVELHPATRIAEVTVNP